jgi:hypothetical protein
MPILTSYFDCAKFSHSASRAHALLVVPQHDWQSTVPPLSPYLENSLLLLLWFIKLVDYCLAVWAAPSPKGVRGWVGGIIESLTSCCASRAFGCVHQSIKESIWSYRSLHSSIFVMYYYYTLHLNTYVYTHSLIHTHTSIHTHVHVHILTHSHTCIHTILYIQLPYTAPTDDSLAGYLDKVGRFIEWSW